LPSDRRGRSVATGKVRPGCIAHGQTVVLIGRYQRLGLSRVQLSRRQLDAD
jgi:hypothetical protein